MIDTHCHLNFKAFADDAPNVANAMARDGVSGIVVGCDSGSSRYAIDLAETFPNLWASVGLHPTHVLDEPWDDITAKELALSDRVVAVGEVGLDFDEGATKRVLQRLAQRGEPVSKEEYFETQYTVFHAAIDLAKLLGKPLILHSRAAYGEVLKVLEEEFTHLSSLTELRLGGVPDRGSRRRPYESEDSRSDILADSIGNDKTGMLRGVIHCFMGNWSQAKRFLSLGFMIGFTGVITYSEVDPQLIEVIKNLPAQRILIETDAPYLTPEPYRSEGKKHSGQLPRNLPQYALEVARVIGEMRGLPTMAVVELTEKNAKKLFELNS